MKNILKLALLLLPMTVLAQAPQIPLTGNIGSGFNGPLINSPAVVFATDADHTMVYPEMSGDGGTLVLTSSSTLTATRNLIVPNTGNFNWFVQNSTIGGQAINVKVSGGSGVAVPSGQTMAVICSGGNCYGSATSSLQNMTQYGFPVAASLNTITSSVQPSSWTSGHTFIPAYQPIGSPLAPTVIDLGSYIGSNVTASAPIVATSSTTGVSLSCPTCGTSSGGTNVSVNGGSSLGNLNINSMAPVADTSFLALTPKISGSNMIVESPYATSSQYGVTLVGASGGADAYGAAGARAGTGNCSSNQYETGDATGGPSCAQVAYSQVSGTPTIPYVPDIIAGNGSGGLKDTTIVSSANYSTLSAALTAIGSSVVTLDVSTPMSISGTVSVPLNISIKVEQVSGGAFTGSGSVTFSGPFSAGLYQVFPTAMLVTFANTGNIVEAVYPQWFGATANTVTDDHAAVQAALNAVNLASGAGSLVRFPTGTYNLGTTGITISQHNTRLVGEGRSVTQFLYSGTGSMITIDSVSGVAVEHMRLSLLSSGAAKIMSILTTTASVIDLRLNDLNIISATDPGKSGSVGLYIAPSGSNIFTSSFINDVHIVDFDSPIYEPGTGNIEGNSWSNIEVSDFGTSTTSLPVGVYANSNTDQWSNLRVAGAYGTTIPASATAYEQISGSDNTVVFSADIGSAPAQALKSSAAQSNKFIIARAAGNTPLGVYAGTDTIVDNGITVNAYTEVEQQLAVGAPPLSIGTPPFQTHTATGHNLYIRDDAVLGGHTAGSAIQFATDNLGAYAPGAFEGSVLNFNYATLGPANFFGPVSMPAGSTVNSKNICLSDGTNCPQTTVDRYQFSLGTGSLSTGNCLSEGVSASAFPDANSSSVFSVSLVGTNAQFISGNEVVPVAWFRTDTSPASPAFNVCYYGSGTWTYTGVSINILSQ